jgi:hypothetical protein
VLSEDAAQAWRGRKRSRGSAVILGGGARLL